MNKADQIMELVKAGKSFAEIAEAGFKEKFIQITLGKNGYDWKTMKPKEEAPAIKEEAPVIKEEAPVIKEPSIDEQMEQMEVNQQASQLAQAMKLVMSNPQSFLLAMGQIEGQAKGVIKKVSKCHRHPDIDVKAGESCDKCLTQSRQHEDLMKNRNFVIPCPECGNAKRQSSGGYIKILPKKTGHYSCGNCKISYNAKGESTAWGANDQHFFDHAFRKGLV